MSRRYHTPLEELVEPGVRVPHIEPLRTRIAKNRWKLVGFTVAYTTGMALSAALTIGFAATLFFAVLLVRYDPLMFADGTEALTAIGRVTLTGFVLALVVAWAWSITRLVRSDLELIARLGARMPEPGTWLPTRRVLHDVSLAAGMKKVPALYVIDTPRVNAFVLGASPERARIGVTYGMLDRVSLDEQRAVFANLIARVLAGDTLWATAVSALIGPLAAYREFDLRSGMPDFGDPHTARAAKRKRTVHTDEFRGVFFLVYAMAVVFTEVLSWYSREAVWRMAEKADAEGMLLLKDPRTMLDAIEHVLDRDNHVPSAGDAFSPLFYCWAGFGFAPEDDPELRRVVRLREALGAEGAAYVPRPNVPDWSNPPVAPRIEQLREIELGESKVADGPR